MSDYSYFFLTFVFCFTGALVLPSCDTSTEDKMVVLAKSIAEQGASVAFTNEKVFVSYGQTLPTGMPENVEIFHSTQKGSPSNSILELREVVSKRPSGQIEVFSSRDAEVVREVLGKIPYQEFVHQNEWTLFRFGE